MQTYGINLQNTSNLLVIRPTLVLLELDHLHFLNKSSRFVSQTLNYNKFHVNKIFTMNFFVIFAYSMFDK